MITRTLFACLTALTLVACASRQPTEAAASEPAAQAPAAPADGHAKVQAPVELTLTTSGAVGEIDVVLTVTARADLPASRARIVLPEGVRVVTGAAEMGLEPIAKGEAATVKLRALVPAGGPFTIAGGIEVAMSPGVQLAKSTTVVVGAAAGAPKTEDVRQLPEGDSVRIGR